MTTSGAPSAAAAVKTDSLTLCTSSQNPAAPKSNTVRARSIAAWVIEELARHEAKQRLRDRQLAGCGGAMDEDQLHAWELPPAQ